MRVISGSARGLRLVCPAGPAIRPTADRLKEALFNILAPLVPGCAFLDLFCGTGAIGIEALSRGAESAVFADSGAAAVRAVVANLEKTRLAERAEVLRMDASAAIELLSNRNRAFDIIFMDPPYAGGGLEAALGRLEKHGILAEGGIAVAETGAGRGLIAGPAFEIADERKYGSAKFIFLRKKPI